MPALQMTYDEVMAQLEAWGSEKMRAIYARMGAGDSQFGVMMGPLRGLAKKLKTNHALGLQLWESGNDDARILAVMILDPAHLSIDELEAMLPVLYYPRLVDEFSFQLAAKSPHAPALRARWMDVPDALTGRAGWNLVCAAAMAQSLTPAELDSLLLVIENNLAAAPTPKQESMNRALVEIGVHTPALTQRCIAIGERVGKLDDKPVPKGCYSTYAPEWIAVVLARKK
ncbi:MAG: DNA alkylation repair protein [Anaerolineae bacterium]|nr:DNA alkylation repair protein [Anaerolineae bacterium]